MPHSVNMSLNAHYKVQTSAYQRLQVGKPLTDRRIAHYIERGYYGSGILALERADKIARTRKKTKVFDLNDFI